MNLIPHDKEKVCILGPIRWHCLIDGTWCTPLWKTDAALVIRPYAIIELKAYHCISQSRCVTWTQWDLPITAQFSHCILDQLQFQLFKGNAWHFNYSNTRWPPAWIILSKALQSRQGCNWNTEWFFLAIAATWFLNYVFSNSIINLFKFNFTVCQTMKER